MDISVSERIPVLASDTLGGVVTTVEGLITKKNCEIE